MTTQDKLISRKLTLIELAEFLKNVSQACKIHGVSRQHFYDIKKAYDENGIEGLKEKTRRKPCLKNRVALEVEDAVLKMAYEYPAYGQLRVSNELRKSGSVISICYLTESICFIASSTVPSNNSSSRPSDKSICFVSARHFWMAGISLELPTYPSAYIE